MSQFDSRAGRIPQLAVEGTAVGTQRFLLESAVCDFSWFTVEGRAAAQSW